MANVLALDIGGTKLATALVDDAGEVFFSRVAPTRNVGPESVLADLFDMARIVLRECEREGKSPDRIGIACGGPLDTDSGVVQSPPNLVGWLDVPVVDAAQRALGLPTHLGNDATAAAMAEYHFGRERGDLIYLTVSTGIGGGAVLGGRPFQGRNGNGGEFGHVIVGPESEARVCECGARGCLEAYASGSSIARQANERQMPESDAAAVAASAGRGDAAASKLWRESLTRLGVGVASLVNILEVPRVVLGGGVTRAGAEFLEPVRSAALPRIMRPALADAVSLEISQFGDRIGLLAAAAVALWPASSSTEP
jgi:glucokinase